jgi:hypothetical protein
VTRAAPINLNQLMEDVCEALGVDVVELRYNHQSFDHELRWSVLTRARHLADWWRDDELRGRLEALLVQPGKSYDEEELRVLRIRAGNMEVARGAGRTLEAALETAKIKFQIVAPTKTAH